MPDPIGFIAYDTTLYRPGCALVQALLGGSSDIAQKFPTSLWLTTPTEHMKVYPVRDAQFLAALIDTSIFHNKELINGH